MVLGNDRALLGNDAFAASNMPFGLGPEARRGGGKQAKKKESPGTPCGLNTGAKAVMSGSWAAAPIPYHPSFSNARNS